MENYVKSDNDVALGSAPVLLLMSRFIMRKMREYKKRVLEMNSQMISFEVDTFYNFDMIKSFGVSDTTEKKLKSWQGKYKEYNLDYNKFEIKAKIGMSLLQTVVSMGAFGYCLFVLYFIAAFVTPYFSEYFKRD